MHQEKEYLELYDICFLVQIVGYTAENFAKFLFSENPRQALIDDLEIIVKDGEESGVNYSRLKKIVGNLKELND